MVNVGSFIARFEEPGRINEEKRIGGEQLSIQINLNQKLFKYIFSQISTLP